MWLEFECAVSDALRVVADSIESLRKWFKDWKPKKVKICMSNKSKWLWVELINIQGEFKWQQ
jgi:hypothetical protein